MGPKDDGTEDTFLALNESPSSTGLESGRLYLYEKFSFSMDGRFATVFAPFSLYFLWKTCPSVQGVQSVRMAKASPGCILFVSSSGLRFFQQARDPHQDYCPNKGHEDRAD